ncbi:MAG: matrixin family metalloprotease [Solirubrobacteraceae bacterium]|nr:matrixin family metalloprotease [Solirubrobacteraceae bacterium]
MRRCLPVALLCAAACLLVPSSASAYVLDKGTGPFTNPPAGGLKASVPLSGAVTDIPQLPALWAAAVRYWGGVPASCVGTGVVFRYSSEDPDADLADTETSAWVYDTELCSIYLNEINQDWPITSDNAYGWCTVITHEMGHMLGLDHSQNKLNLMTGDWIPDATPECNRFTADGSFYLPKIDDPYYDKKGRRRSAAQRAEYLRKKAAAKRRATARR